MPRRAKPKSQKRGWRWYASMGLNGLVALSMVFGTVLLFSGGSIARPAVPTIVAPTVEVNSPAVTPLPPSPTSAPTVPTPLLTPTP